MRNDLRKSIQNQILLGDGAMGTFLYQKGLPIGISYEELNITKPQTIAEVHRHYYDAGARFIETNTFSANREKLSKYGLEHEVKAINQAGVKIAREAVGADAFIIGAMGSIQAGKRQHILQKEIEYAFREQIEALLDTDVDGFILETFYHFEEMQMALKLIREASQLPVICQFATDGIGLTQDGVNFNEAFIKLKQSGADVVGFNCRVGPNGILRSIERLQKSELYPFSIFPNAGLPDYVDGEFTYAATPQYFAENAVKFARLGARIIGGCCGTTPEHIAAMSEALNQFQELQTIHSASNHVQTSKVEKIEINDTNSAQDLQIKVIPTLVDLVYERPTVIVELDPPRDLDIEKFMKGAQELKNAHVDAITMADNSLAITRMSNLALGSIIKEKIHTRPLVHIACRDRNLIGAQSHLMGLHALGIDHVLAVTGDPAKFGDLPGSSSVYDMTSFDMIRMIKQLNEGISFSGKTLKKKANFIVGAAFNPNVKYLEKAIERLERKVAAGADYIMTQPIYDPHLVQKLHDATKHISIPIFIGVMPLASGRNAEYLHNEVPGIELPEIIRNRMRGLEGDEGRKIGTQIAKEMIDAILPYFRGIYLMTPFLYYEMSVELTQYVWLKSKRKDLHLYPFSK